MVLINPPGYLQAGTYDAAKDRQYIITASHYKSGSDNSRCRGGILPDTAARSAPISVSGFNVTIGPFRAIVANNFAANAGDYIVASPNSEMRTMTGSSPTTNRIDMIGVIVRDAFYSGAANDCDVVIIEGAPSAGTPAPPTVPSNFQTFYQLQLNANATAPIVTDLRQRTSMLGGNIPVFPNQMGQGGVNPGEHRIFPPSGAAPQRHAVWGEDGAWHGINTFGLEFGGWVISSLPTNRAIASVTIPDPNYAYRLQFGIVVHAGFDGLNGWNFTVRDGTGSGGTIYARGAWETRDPDNAFTGTFGVAIAGSKAGVLTGGRVVTLWAERKFGAGTQGMSVSADSYGSVLVVPA